MTFSEIHEISDHALVDILQNRGYVVHKNVEVNIEEAARITGFSVETLREKVQTNSMPFKKYGYRTLRFLPSDLVAWKESLAKPSKYVARPKSLMRGGQRS